MTQITFTGGSARPDQLSAITVALADGSSSTDTVSARTIDALLWEREMAATALAALNSFIAESGMIVETDSPLGTVVAILSIGLGGVDQHG